MPRRPSLPPEQTRLRASVAAHESWARTPDRTARTRAAREAMWRRYLDRAAELHPGAPAEVVERAAEHLRQADMQRMSLKAARARQAKAAARAREAVNSDA